MNSGTSNTYSIKTLMGTWQEARAIEEHERSQFLNKCSKGQLIIQKMALLQDTFLKVVPTSGPRDKYLHFHDRVGLVCPPPSMERVRVNHSYERPRIIVAVSLDESLIYGAMKLSGGARLIGTTAVKPLARSVFQVISPEVCPKECKVTYGAPVQFLLATEELSDKPLYMASDSLMSTKGVQQKSGHRGVFLSADRCNYNTHWVFQHVDPQIRLEFEGQPVPVNTPVIIRHCKTNSALAIEHKKSWGLLDFEYEVSSCNHLDGHRAENDTNQICVCTNLDVCESLSDVKSDAEKLLKTMST